MSDLRVTCKDQRAVANAPEQMSGARLKRLLEAFNADDIDTVMSFFPDDCVPEIPRASDLWAQSMQGPDQLRQGFGSALPAVTTRSRGREPR